jgi:hypothetical protein
MKIKNLATWVSIFSLLCSLGAANGQTKYGDWFIVRADDGTGDVIAGTSTDGSAKELLGYRCFAKSQKCMHILVANTACSEGNSYPMLINSVSGAYKVDGICSKVKNFDQLLLTPYDSIRTPIEKDGGLIGFAIPMESGAFKAVRFSLKGAKSATDAAERMIQQSTPISPSSRTGSNTF